MNTAEQIQERRAEGEERNPVVLTPELRDLLHEGVYLEHMLLSLRDRMYCPEDVVVIEEQIEIVRAMGRRKK